MPSARIYLPPGAYTGVGITGGTVPTLTAGTLSTAGPINVGQSVTYTPSHSLGSLSTYQWRRNGVDIAGATSATYTATLADAVTTLTCQEILGDKQAPVVSAGVSVNASGAFSDNFDRADGALGANWAFYQNLTGNLTPGFRVESNRLRINGSSVAGTQINRTTTIITGSAFSEMRYISASAGNGRWGPALVDTANTRCYYFLANVGVNFRQLFRRVGTTDTQIATASSSAIPGNTLVRIERTIVDANTVRIRVLQGGTQIISFDDTSADRISTDVFGGIFADCETGANVMLHDDFSQGTF